MKIGIIGLGMRGYSLFKDCILEMEDVELLAVCDEYQDRVERAQNASEEKRNITPFGSTNYRDILAIKEIEAVIVSTAWEAHVEIAVAAFFESVMAGVDMPIDVYDTASWMCISALSEESITKGGASVDIPDFTSGKWIKETPRTYIEEYRLDRVTE